MRPSRSLLTKIVGPDDVGKIFSVLGSMQALMPLVGTPFFGFLYRSTVEAAPATFLYVTAGMCFVQFVLIVVVAYVFSRSVRKRDEAKKCDVDVKEEKAVKFEKVDESTEFLEKGKAEEEKCGSVGK